MAYQSVFQRYELKYMLTQEQKRMVLETMVPYMELDKYGRTRIAGTIDWICRKHRTIHRSAFAFWYFLRRNVCKPTGIYRITSPTQRRIP